MSLWATGADNNRPSFLKHRVLSSEAECFYDWIGEELPEGGEESREVRTRNPIGAVSSVTRVVLAWEPQNRRCLLGSADRAGF